MSEALHAAQVMQEAKRLEAGGRLSDAGSLLQSFLIAAARSPGLRDERRVAFEMLLGVLFRQGRSGRMGRTFRQYVAACCEMQDPGYDELYLSGLAAAGASPLPLRRRDRFLLLIRQLERTLGLPGLVAECGCFRGLSSYLLCSRLKRHDPAFDGTGYRIYDSFRGLSELRPEDAVPPDLAASAPGAEDMAPGRFAASLEEVKQALAAFPHIEYFPGWIPQAFPATRDDRYRFVHVDVDLYQPTKDSLEYFWPRLNPGGVIVCDDYNWPGARRAVEEFCAAAGVPFAVTPQTQAYFSRPA